MKKLLPKTATIEIENVGSVLLKRSSRAKRMNISIKPFRGVRVAVPHNVSFKQAERLARNKCEWLKANVIKMHEYEKACEAAAENKTEMDRLEARKILVGRLEKIAQEHGYEYNRVSIRNQKTRWGSCSRKNNISLNIRLTLLPEDLCNFILLHELVHTKVKNHGNDFWEALLKAEPNARELDKRVNQYDLRLI